ncbi:hypothetical protein M949_2017 [Riemerella anatipestifer CH3]|nr:hypothetical protein M949_2017 [Riemerella anatipestifer CH3]
MKKTNLHIKNILYNNIFYHLFLFKIILLSQFIFNTFET